MYQLNLKLTNKQYNLLSEALFFYSEEKEDTNIEELQDLFDTGSKKIQSNKRNQTQQVK